MDKIKLTQEQFDSSIELMVNGLFSTDKSITEAIDYCQEIPGLEATLAFYTLWNAIGKDYLLVRKDSVQISEE